MAGVPQQDRQTCLPSVLLQRQNLLAASAAAQPGALPMPSSHPPAYVQNDIPLLCVLRWRPQCTLQDALDYLVCALTYVLDFALMHAVTCASGICSQTCLRYMLCA